MTPKSYKDNFFSHHLQMSISSAEQVIPLVLDYFKPTSVLDIGCGVGTWLSVWQSHGVKDIIGVDGDYVDVNDLLIPRESFVVSNLEDGFEFSRKFGLVSCLEVAEHISDKSAETLINCLCKVGDVILFSAAIPGQEGTLHINEQYPTYWLKFFLKNDFIPIDCIRRRIWSNEKVSFWYRQNILLYVHKSALNNLPLLKAEAAKTDINFLNLVHPGYFDYKTKKALNYERILTSRKAMLKLILKQSFNKFSKIQK